MRAFSSLYHITGFSGLLSKWIWSDFYKREFVGIFQHRTECDVTNGNLKSCIVLLPFRELFILTNYLVVSRTQKSEVQSNSSFKAIFRTAFDCSKFQVYSDIKIQFFAFALNFYLHLLIWIHHWNILLFFRIWSRGKENILWKSKYHSING